MNSYSSGETSVDINIMLMAIQNKISWKLCLMDTDYLTNVPMSVSTI